MPKGGTYNFIMHHPNPIYKALRLVQDEPKPLFGQALKERLKQRFLEELVVEFEIFGESLPWKGSYVDLDPDKRNWYYDGNGTKRMKE